MFLNRIKTRERSSAIFINRKTRYIRSLLSPNGFYTSPLNGSTKSLSSLMNDDEKKEGGGGGMEIFIIISGTFARSRVSQLRDTTDPIASDSHKISK